MLNFFDIDYFVQVDQQDHRKNSIFVVIHRMIHLKYKKNKNFFSFILLIQTNQVIVVFEEDLRNKYSFDELLLIYAHNVVLFREEAKTIKSSFSIIF